MLQTLCMAICEQATFFHDDKKEATIIDFDLAGVNGEKKYPNGFNTVISDGARAHSASESGILLFAHDWFAIGAMMKLCVLEDCEQGDWVEACKLLEGVNPSSGGCCQRSWSLGEMQKCFDQVIKRRQRRKSRNGKP
jgi:hypothetical protein